MINTRSRTVKNLLAVILLFSLIGIIGFSGCSTAETPADTAEEEPAVEEQDEVTEEKPEETAPEEEATEEATEEEEEEITDLSKMAITGNINLLSGLEISDTVLNTRPIAIMVQNNPVARPQSGLYLADIIIEIVDEGGVTRYIAVYSSNDANPIWSVRSTRPYYAEFARSFDPIYAFWGTYPEAYEVVRNLDMDVLDGNSDVIAYANSAWRERDRSDALEHTGVMSTTGLKEDAVGYGYSLEGGQSPFQFKIDAVESERGNIGEITVDFSYDSYIAGFTYNKEENIYYKSLAGQPHLDNETGIPITSNNIIVMITTIEGPIDQYGHMAVRTIGTSDIGKCFFFMDGKKIEGTWERSSVFDPFTYKDDDGNLILFNRGSTYIGVIQSIDRLSY